MTWCTLRFNPSAEMSQRLVQQLAQIHDEARLSTLFVRAVQASDLATFQAGLAN